MFEAAAACDAVRCISRRKSWRLWHKYFCLITSLTPSLPHSLTPPKPNFHPPVQRPPLFCFVIGDGLGEAVAGSVYLIGRHAPAEEVGAYRFRPVLGKGLVVFGAADVVGMASHFHFQAVSFDHLRQPVEFGEGFSLYGVFIGFKKEVFQRQRDVPFLDFLQCRHFYDCFRIESGGAAADAWSTGRVAQLRAAGAPVLVNFTAAWCITCKVNEQVALDTRAVVEALDAHGVAYLKADWTRRDAKITAELQRHGRSGVPLYLLYAAGDPEPRVLPQLLTERSVLDAIADIGIGKPEKTP